MRSATPTRRFQGLGHRLALLGRQAGADAKQGPQSVLFEIRLKPTDFIRLREDRFLIGRRRIESLAHLFMRSPKRTLHATAGATRLIEHRVDIATHVFRKIHDFERFLEA